MPPAAERHLAPRLGGLDIFARKPLDACASTFVPALFVAGAADTFVGPHHSRALQAAYAGDSELVILEGPHDHNSIRPRFFMEKAGNFVRERLGIPEEETMWWAQAKEEALFAEAQVGFVEGARGEGEVAPAAAAARAAPSAREALRAARHAARGGTSAAAAAVSQSRDVDVSNDGAPAAGSAAGDLEDDDAGGDPAEAGGDGGGDDEEDEDEDEEEEGEAPTPFEAVSPQSWSAFVARRREEAAAAASAAAEAAASASDAAGSWERLGGGDGPGGAHPSREEKERVLAALRRRISLARDMGVGEEADALERALSAESGGGKSGGADPAAATLAEAEARRQVAQRALEAMEVRMIEAEEESLQAAIEASLR